MRTKLAMLLALCRGAELLILDEPTSGLDPAMAEEMLQALVGHVAAEGSTVFFSSHQLAEVEQIADHVAIIDRGQAVVAGALDDLRAQYRRIQLVFEANAPDIKVHAPGTHRVRRQGRVLTVLSFSAGDAVIEELRGYRPSSFEVSPVSLKDIFLESVRAADGTESTESRADMLWHKAWLETRWRFISAMVILTMLAGSSVYGYLAIAAIAAELASTPASPVAESSGVAAAIREAIEVQKDFRGFIWYRTFRDNLMNMGVFFAILLGCGGLLSESSKGSALFTLVVAGDTQAAARRACGHRPRAAASRSRWCRRWSFRSSRRRSASGSASLMRWPMACACSLSQRCSSAWRRSCRRSSPISGGRCSSAVGIACLLAIASFAVPQLDVFSVMSGESYFKTGSLPWAGFLTSAVIATALLYSAAETLGTP